MNGFNKSVKWLHKATGLTIGIFFIMWFVTGIVLLYHSYPRVTSQDRYVHMESLDITALPDLDSIPGLSDTVAVQTLSVEKRLGETLWTISGLSIHKETPMDAKPIAGGEVVVEKDSLVAPKAMTLADVEAIACGWVPDGKIVKTDTLHHRQQWVMYERYEKSLPILRYYFDNPDKTEVFISQQDGEVLQVTTRSERFWSWIGAIPHKLYFPFLRKDVKRWENVLLAGGLFCLFAALSGVYLGIYFLIANKRKNNKIGSPFKKRIWKYHHISGLVFGIFLIAWGISGSLAMQRVPKWMVGYEGDYFVSSSKLWGKKPLELGEYRLDYRKLFSKFKNIKGISWVHFGDQAAYLVVAEDKEIYIDATNEEAIVPLYLDKATVENAVKRYFGNDVSFKIFLIDQYDEYYLSQKGGYPLPAWKVDIENEDGSRMYISPSDGYVKYLNHNRMAKKWLFSATHYLGIKYFVLHKTLRYISLWMLCLGCIFVCATGLGIWLTKTVFHNYYT